MAAIEMHGEFPAHKLLEWFGMVRRDLPWRRLSHDPYAVWVSEIMLQQTQVATVIPYFERWMLRFPTVRALADAPIDEILVHWSGLGYYARARNLHRAAQIVCEKHAGSLPVDSNALSGLPGIGKYTTGAILSIAHNIPAPIVDGNVARVLTRVFTLSGDPKSSAVQAELWKLAKLLIPEGFASDFNQAMMELGALVCTPFDPDCSHCPLTAACLAAKTPDPSLWPQTPPGHKMIRQSHVSVVLMDHGSTLLRKRPQTGLWGGLWEFPRSVCQNGETLEECAMRTAAKFLGPGFTVGDAFHNVRHTVTHHNIVLHGFKIQRLVERATWTAPDSSVHWVQWQSLAEYPLSAPQKLLAQEAAKLLRL